MSNIEVATKKTFNLMPTSYQEATHYAKIIASSGMVPKAYQGKPQDVFVAMQWGVSIGLHPLQALQNLSVINGKPALWGDAALAMVQRHKDYEYIKETISQTSEGITATCIIKRSGHEEHTSSFSVEDAKRAGLWGKSGPWTQYPKRMLQMRARAFALRNIFSDALMGVGVTEEVIDMPDVTHSVISPAGFHPSTEENNELATDTTPLGSVAEQVDEASTSKADILSKKLADL